jgi:hypothetical protein
MKSLLSSSVLLVALTLTAWAQQTAIPQQTAESQAHAVVMRFLQGVRMVALPEGKQMLTDTQWIVGEADRGQNYYSRPDYAEVTPIYATLFDTDIPTVQGYKELLAMKAVTEAGTTRNLKYLIISFKDTSSGKWKVLSAFDNADAGGGDSNLDVDHQIAFFKNYLSDPRASSPRDTYATYGTWLLLGGHIMESRAALELAKKMAPTSQTNTKIDPIRDIQIDLLLQIIVRIAPQTILRVQ